MELICYLSNGYPSIEASNQLAHHYVTAGCDVIEIDFPAKDPYLESPYLANRMQKSLEVCSDYGRYMQEMIQLKKQLPATRFILLAYEATVKEIGYEKFSHFCIQNQFEDMILVGLTDDTIKNKLIQDGIRVSCYVQFHMLPEEIASAKQSNGFVYMQGKPADDTVHPDYPALKDCIKYLRSQGIQRSIYCGVGIHTPEDVEMAKDAGADGVFVGSTILKLQQDVPALIKTIQEFKARC